MPAAAAAGHAQAAQHQGGGGNPFQLASNWYAEKNNQGGTTSYAVGTTAAPVGGAINAGQYLRGVRLIVRTATAGTAGTATTNSDAPWSLLSQVDLVNVDGSEILYNMGGYSHYIAQKYTRPWQGDPALYPDAQASTITSPQFTLFLQPEIRWTAGVLANTDTRSQYRFDATIDTGTNYSPAGLTTGPVVSVTPYMDAWAQPDDRDLQGTPNQPIPPGLNLQVKRRHQIFTLNANGSDNILQSALTGNALRCQIFITRTTVTQANQRSDLFTDPIQWQLDNRSMGKISTQVGTTQAAGSGLLEQWMFEQYGEYFPTAAGNGAAVATAYVTYKREVGVYVFPRFIKPGSMFGQAWLYTANNTKEIFETTTSSNFSSAATAELISDEVYPVGPVDSALTDI